MTQKLPEQSQQSVQYVPLTSEERNLLDLMLYSAAVTGWLVKKDRPLKRSIKAKLANADEAERTAKEAEVATLEKMLAATGETEVSA